MLPAADALTLALLPCHEEAATLIPPPRLHRHRYHGVLAPSSPQRAQVTALARPATPLSPAPLAAGDPAQYVEPSPARFLWAVLLARIYEIFPLRCALCGAEMRIIAFITQAPALPSILTHLGEPTSPPEVAPARGPPLWDPVAEPAPRWDEAPAPVPEFVFDQPLELVARPVSPGSSRAAVQRLDDPGMPRSPPP